MKVLVNIPSLKHLGGVANHYSGLRPFWTEQIRYNVVGRRNAKAGSGKFWLPWDIIKFIFQLISFRPDVVLLNPSLGYSALKRDFIFLNIAYKLGFKVAVFIHGFDWGVAESIDKKWVVSNLNRANLIFVLARSFKDELERWGVLTSVVLSTTKVDDNLLTGYNQKLRTGRFQNLLYLARVERAKGIYITIDTYAILKKRYSQLRLTIVGNGSELPAVRKYITEKGLNDITVTGALSGRALIEAYRNADASSLFSSHGEGMPTSVLEAMAFGLPVFTRKVGGLSDFFENGKMGYITDSIDPRDFAEAMIPYIDNPELALRVSNYNHAYATKHFMASHVAREIESQLKQIIC